MNSKVKGHLALIAVNLFYGAGFTVAKVLMPHKIQPLGYILIRVSVVTVLFWLSWLFGKKYRATIERKDWITLILGGLFGVALNQMLFFLGLNNTMPIHASLVMLSTPILITIIALFVLREKFRWDKMLGLLLGISGAVILMSAGQEVTALGKDTAFGDSLVFLNATSYAIYLVIIKKLMHKYRPIIVIRWVFLFGLCFVFPFGFQQVTVIDWSSFVFTDWLSLGFIVLGVTFFAYLWNTYALAHLSPSVVGAYIYAQPVFAAIISIIFTGEAITLPKIIATLLIFSGVYFVNFGLKRKNITQ